MTSPIVEFKSVGKYFGIGEHALRGAHEVSFALRAGRSLALVGESGSGKTTCARLIMREHIPNAGDILFKGKSIHDKNAVDVKTYRKAVQMIFQDPFSSLNPAHTIEYHLKRPLALYRPDLRGSEIDTYLENLLSKVELDASLILKKHPYELSGGQRQRVNIARTLAVGAEVVIADEPTSMLDVSVRLGILNLLNEMKTELGLAMLYITHDVATARYVAEDIMVMYAGQILEWGPISSVIDNPQHEYTRLLLSAVPDPKLRFDNEASRLEPAVVNKIRENARKDQPTIIEFGNGHFYRT